MQPSGSNSYEDPHAYEYSTPADIMNIDATVYGGPSATLYAPIGSVVKNGTINILNKENEHYYISYWTNSGQLKRGYVAISQINRNTTKTVAEVTKTYQGNNNTVNPQTTVYSGPDTTTAVIGAVFAQEGITQFTLEENGFHFIEYSTSEGAKRGYILSSNLIRKEGGLAIASTAADVYYAYSLESKAGAIYANEYVTILQKNDQRSYIEYNTTSGRKRGYVSNSSLQFLDTGEVPALPNYSEETLLPAETMKVYFGPSDKYAVVGSINKGEQVTRLSSPALNTGSYSFVQYSTAEGTKRGYVTASGLVPYVPGVVPDPGPGPNPDPNPDPDPDPDSPGVPAAGDGPEDWSGWYLNEDGLPSPNPPHDTPKKTEEEQYNFNNVWKKYGDIGSDGTVPPTRTQIVNYLTIMAYECGLPVNLVLAVLYTEGGIPHFKDELEDGTYNTIVTGGKGKTEAELDFSENLDWGLMQINAKGNPVYFQRKDLYGNIITNWHANARVGIIFIRDAYMRKARGQRTIDLNGAGPSEAVVKDTYKWYNAGMEDNVPRFYYEVYMAEPKHWINDTGLDPGNDPLINEHPLESPFPKYSDSFF
jgi:hypothetical protein